MGKEDSEMKCFGFPVPELDCFRKVLTTIQDSQSLNVACRQFCHLNITDQIESIENIEFQESSADYYMLDSFRLKHAPAEEPWIGVEFVLRQSVELDKDSQSLTQDSNETQPLTQDSSDTSLLS